MAREESTDRVHQDGSDEFSRAQLAGAVLVLAISLPAMYVVATTPSRWLLPPMELQRFTQLERWALLLFLVTAVGFGVIDVAGNVLEVAREEWGER